MQAVSRKCELVNSFRFAVGQPALFVALLLSLFIELFFFHLFCNKIRSILSPVGHWNSKLTHWTT